VERFLSQISGLHLACCRKYLTSMLCLSPACCSNKSQHSNCSLCRCYHPTGYNWHSVLFYLLIVHLIILQSPNCLSMCQYKNYTMFNEHIISLLLSHSRLKTHFPQILSAVDCLYQTGVCNDYGNYIGFLLVFVSSF